MTKILDRVGISASLICAVHCILFPIMLIIMPVIGSTFLYSHSVEKVFLLFSLLLASFSLCIGFKEHHSHSLLGGLLVASGFLITGQFLYHGYLFGRLMVAGGGFILASLHFINIRLCEQCNRCDH